MSLLVRLKPYNERKGHLVRVYMIGGWRFLEERGWYEVPEALVEQLQLRELHQAHYNEDSPALFDVCTPEQAERLEEKERAREEREKATARKPTPIESAKASSSRDLSTADLTPTPKMIDPDPDGEELDEASDDGRIASVGKVTAEEGAGPKPRRKK